MAMLVASSAIAQVTPLWKVNYSEPAPSPGAVGSYYDDKNFGRLTRTLGLANQRESSSDIQIIIGPPINLGPTFVRTDATIDFSWGTGSPDSRIAADTFSIRWVGRIAPKATGNYTFFAVSDDGIRVQLDGTIIIDSFVNQAATEHPSSPIALNEGWVYTIQVDYYEDTGSAAASLLWSGPGLGKQPVTFQGGSDGSSARFGEVLAVVADRVAVAAPKAEGRSGSASSPQFHNDTGSVSFYDLAGSPSGATTAPLSTQSREYGTSLAAFGDGRLLVGAGDGDTTGTRFYVGAVHLHDAAGTLLRTWPNPDGQGTANANQYFGFRVETLPGDRFVASSLATPGKVFLFDASTVSTPLAVMNNPATGGATGIRDRSNPPWTGEFGSALAVLGGNKLLVGSPRHSVDNDQAGSVFLYDLSGNLLRTVHNPFSRPDFFGAAIAAVDEHRFLVGAPAADQIYLDGTLRTNSTAGVVYLFDDSGTRLRTYNPPDPARAGNFGVALAMLGADRILIGSSNETVASFTGAGSVHLFTLDGVPVASVANPTPGVFDQFGATLVALDNHRFVVGAPGDDTVRPDAGSIYAFDAPISNLELGMEIPRPPNVNVDGNFPSGGPGVDPPGAAFWHAASQKLFAVRPGPILVSWPLNGGTTNNIQAVLGWPSDQSRFQLHVAGPTPVDLSGGGVFSHATLHTTSTDASADLVRNTRVYSATTPGLSLVMLSSGPPENNPIRFQFVRTVAWNDPAHLHDNASATIGQPIADPGGYHDVACGAPQVILPGAPFCPPPVFDPATRSGTIIPVNRGNSETEADDLVVAFYRVGTQLFDPVTGAKVSNSICWPHKPVRFVPQWPSDAPHLVIASQQGTGVIDTAQFQEWDLYFQNDPAQAGFNPNDEHALRRPVTGGEGVFALRDDLGTANTSEPFVLIRFRDPSAGGQFRMKVWKVVAQEAPFFFKYPARAGQLIQAPFPLSTLALAQPTAGVSGPFFRDRKLFFWAKAAGDDGGTAEIVMRYFYPVQPSFFFPVGNPPAVGENVPWLDQRAGTPGTPINIAYETSWPTDVPELRVGETLVRPKNGLPQIAGQTSVEILYQQAQVQGQGASVRLIDPIRIRSVPLTQLPPDVATRVKAGLLYFPTLPPHLVNRVRFDPVARRLELLGEFIEPPAGEAYLLLNVLTARDRSVLAALTTDTLFRNAVDNLATVASSVADVPPDSSGFDSLALTAGNALGAGYVTLAFGNSSTLSAPAEPISLSIIKVTCPLYRGELKVIPSFNPLDEQLTLRHSGDFDGRPEDFEFEWRTLPPVDGLPSRLPPEQWVRFQPTPATGIGATDITITGPGLYTLSDNYFIARYRRVNGANPCGSAFSEWTAPMLAEGWIKRVLAGIGPFEQRIKDYQDTQVNTIVNMIAQAGARAVGDVALNLDAVNQAGLIEVYETVLRRGMSLSIEGAPPVDYPPANDALLLAASRLADLYMLLGNEAYADAADPTIAFGTDDGVYGAQATSIHCFMNQTASLLEEELALLRGRDSSKLPSIQTHPTYNRLIWNFTRDITGGEVAYALNYNIRNQDGDVTGTINEADAKRLYPQGHGDAWGHYLAAIKNYYRLLRNPSFTWVPRIEAVIVGGVAVSVDYLDERKFAAAAAARARTGAEIVNLTSRETYSDTPSKPWQAQFDSDSNRAWGMSEWASRAGQGALFDWVVANAILPEVDSNSAHTGIQKIERGTVHELPEIAEAFRQIQVQADQADSGLNPLGLANNVVPFDIDPGAIAAGKTHFEQINERAGEALKNAVAVFDHANASTQLLRRQADDANSFQQRVVENEADYNNRLIEIFGTPFADDIGPVGTYPTGYAGPDIYHYNYVDSPEIQVGATRQQPTLRLQIADIDVRSDGALISSPRSVTFHFSPNGFGLEKPSTWVGQRSAQGEIQLARSALLEALRRLERGVAEYENLLGNIEDLAAALVAERGLFADQIRIRKEQLNQVNQLNDEISDLRRSAHSMHGIADITRITTDFPAEALTEVVGLASDVFSGLRALIHFTGRMSAIGFDLQGRIDEMDIANKEDSKSAVSALTDLKLFTAQANFSQQERLRQLEQLVRGEPTARLELAAVEQSLEQATGRYQAAIARGLRLLEERTRFRQETAAQIQTHRHKDMAFRIFRSDALEKYRAQFDLAARYAYLAAKAYDYETCLAPGDNRGPANAFLSAIIRARSLGLISNGTPLAGSGKGDPGLTDPLARLNANWNLVLKGQLGFNNPQTETGRFSLRNELFRILTGPAGNQKWREALERLVVPDLLTMPEFQRHCIPFTPTQAVEPGIVIPFATTINFGLNFFGWPAGGGDNDYDSTKFATKVRSVGVWFANYNNLGGGMINTPRVYLIPVGLDVMRAPSQGSALVREWRVLDQALPVPFPLSAGSFNNPSFIPINDTLNEDFAAIRRFGRFRAFHDSGTFKPEETITDTRLIGRSVWNTRWLLVIPGGTLHTDRNEGIQRFINGALRSDGTRDGNGVADIRIFFQTYAYSGN